MDVENPNAKDSPENLGVTLQSASTIAIGLTAVSFTLGLLIVNLRLGYFGVYASELLRTEYVLVGAAFLVLSASAYLSVTHAHHLFHKLKGKWKSGSRIKLIVRMIVLIPLSVALPFLVLYYSSDGRLHPLNWRAWLALVSMFGSGLLIRQAIISASMATQLMFARTTDVPTVEKAESGITVLLALPMFVMVLISYAHMVYPSLMPALGGGHRGQVMLAMTDDGLSVAKKLNLPTQVGDELVGPLLLLTESKDEVIVVVDMPDDSRLVLDHPDPSHAVRVDRKLIDAIVARPWRKFQQWTMP